MRTKAASIAAMIALGAAALAVQAWLVEWREGRPLTAPYAPSPDSERAAYAAVVDGARGALLTAQVRLGEDRRSEGVRALDAAFRAAEVADHAANEGHLGEALMAIRSARTGLHNGNENRALREIDVALGLLERGTAKNARPLTAGELARYVGATVIDAHGVRIGEVSALRSASGGLGEPALEIALGGPRDVAGFVDFAPAAAVTAPTSTLAFGPVRFLGPTLVAATGIGARSLDEGTLSNIR